MRAAAEGARESRGNSFVLWPRGGRGHCKIPWCFGGQCAGHPAPGYSFAARLHGGGSMSGDIHFDAGTLTEYWLGTLPKPEEELIEEHLFACDECGARLDEV